MSDTEYRLCALIDNDGNKCHNRIFKVNLSASDIKKYEGGYLYCNACIENCKINWELELEKTRQEAINSSNARQNFILNLIAKEFNYCGSYPEKELFKQRLLNSIDRNMNTK